LVLLYFMHLKYENKLIWSFGIFYPLVLFIIMIGMIVIDVFLRVIPK
jgi:heme/copper-type cytochrome/quinol oxidase subunit 4